MLQADQKAVLEEFHMGAFNTLVATCIGEEGLDIPAVDLIVCCDRFVVCCLGLKSTCSRFLI